MKTVGITALLLVATITWLIRAMFWLRDERIFKQFIYFIRRFFKYHLRSAEAGVLIGAVLTVSAFWITRDVAGVFGWIAYVAMFPVMGILLMAIWGIRVAWFYFRQAASNLDDERSDRNE